MFLTLSWPAQHRIRQIHAVLYMNDILACHRGDPLHMDNNVCTKALNGSGFAGNPAVVIGFVLFLYSSIHSYLQHCARPGRNELETKVREELK